jgi:hypothetical protein
MLSLFGIFIKKIHIHNNFKGILKLYHLMIELVEANKSFKNCDVVFRQ